tara:strand:- start:22854 stop:23873 length:1020 start_codon:yes stop_codon:yes gene_type:complete
MPIAVPGDSRSVIIAPVHVRAAQLAFPTIITQFEDKWTPRWKEDYVYGRQDPIAFFGGTSRSLTLGFRVISDDPTEASENMQKIQALIQYQYPTYQNRGGKISTLKAPPYFKIKIMDSITPGIDYLRGYMTSGITINPGFQSKEKAQYYTPDYKKVLFSDVEIIIRMTILHHKRVGYYNDSFGHGTSYPYNIPSNQTVNTSANGVAQQVQPVNQTTQTGAPGGTTAGARIRDIENGGLRLSLDGMEEIQQLRAQRNLGSMLQPGDDAFLLNLRSGRAFEAGTHPYASVHFDHEGAAGANMTDEWAGSLDYRAAWDQYDSTWNTPSDQAANPIDIAGTEF